MFWCKALKMAHPPVDKAKGAANLRETHRRLVPRPQLPAAGARSRSKCQRPAMAALLSREASGKDGAVASTKATAPNK